MASNDELFRFFDFSREMLAIVSANTRLWARVNNAFSDTLGWAKDEPPGQQFTSLVHPDDAQQAETSLMQPGLGTEANVFDCRMRCKNQDYLLTEWHAALLPDEGLIYLAGRPKNKGQQTQKQSEEQLRLLIESAKDFSFFTTDAEGIITGWSEGAHRIFGWEADEIIGKNCEILFIPEHREAGVPQQELETAARYGRAADERFHIRKDGSRFYASGFVYPMEDDGLHGFVKIARDMTETMQASEALRESEQRLKTLVKLREEFIAIASHELKTPITSMKVYAEIAQERMAAVGNENDRELLTKLNAQIDRLTRLINDLLDTTRIAEGQLNLQMQDTNLKELLTERVEELKLTSRHHIVLQAPQLPPVPADRERIRQVVTNLLSNAIKYSPEGGTITISAALREGAVEVSVQDQGHGIALADQQRIFDRFYRIAANDDTLPGVGLGLYISQQIVQRHGGSIAVRSAPGKGSTFTFTLPLQPGVSMA